MLCSHPVSPMPARIHAYVAVVSRTGMGGGRVVPWNNMMSLPSLQKVRVALDDSKESFELLHNVVLDCGSCLCIYFIVLQLRLVARVELSLLV